MSQTLQVAKISIDQEDNVTIILQQRVIVAPSSDGEASREKYVRWSADTDFGPHPDLKAAMTGLRKYALEVVELPNDDKFRSQFDVISMDIAGDMDLQNSRVKLILGKYIKRTNKLMKINDVPQVAMYTDEYDKAKDMVKAIEKVIAECWLYLNGKNGDGYQFSLGEQFEARAREVKAVK